MSMNLKCKEVELAQTPTYITKMCLFRHNGRKDSWENVLFRYTLWYSNEFGFYCGTQAEIDAHRAVCDAHLRSLVKAVRKHGRLHFYMV